MMLARRLAYEMQNALAGHFSSTDPAAYSFARAEPCICADLLCAWLIVSGVKVSTVESSRTSACILPRL